jgi:hypothetical protein
MYVHTYMQPEHREKYANHQTIHTEVDCAYFSILLTLIMSKTKGCILPYIHRQKWASQTFQAKISSIDFLLNVDDNTCKNQFFYPRPCDRLMTPTGHACTVNILK